MWNRNHRTRKSRTFNIFQFTQLRMARGTASLSDSQEVPFFSRKVLIWLKGAAETARSTRT